jgi:hypothetical protein
VSSSSSPLFGVTLIVIISISQKFTQNVASPLKKQNDTNYNTEKVSLSNKFEPKPV